MDVYDIHGNLIPEIWKAEFRGFFMGEGCLWFGKTFRKNKPNTPEKATHKSSPLGYYYYRTEAIISLRLDDLEILQDIQSRLGGKIMTRYIYHNRPTCKPSARWWVGSKEGCQRIVDILSSTVLPAKKMYELPLWSEAVCLRKIRGGGYISDQDRERLEEILQAIRDIRKFKVQT